MSEVKEDSVSYIFGLFLIIFGEYLVLKQPEYFVLFFVSVISILVIRR